MNANGRALLYTLMAAMGVVALYPTSALAHDGPAPANGFLTGFLHPLSGLDHMLAMICVGLWGAFLGRPLIALLPVLFPGAMVIGGVLGMAAVPFPPVELGIALSVVVLGLLILFAARAPVAVACALFHGYAHGQELPAAADPVGYSAGFVISTGLLHVAGILLGMLKSVPAGVIGLRAGGGAIALIGAWFLFGAVAA